MKRNTKRIILIACLVVAVATALIIILVNVHSKRNEKPYYWVAIGDSITWGEGEDGISYTDHMVADHSNIVADKRAVPGMKTRELVLYGNNGFFITDRAPDVVTVMMGTNDFGMNIPPEEYSRDLSELTDTIKKYFPESEIIYLTPLYRDYFGKRGFILSGMVNDIGHHLYEYRDIIINHCKQNGLRCIELSEKDYLNAENLHELTVDGLHPNSKGNQLIADNLYKEIFR